jgi:hypothetical protein
VYLLSACSSTNIKPQQNNAAINSTLKTSSGKVSNNAEKTPASEGITQVQISTKSESQDQSQSSKTREMAVTNGDSHFSCPLPHQSCP